MSDLKACPHCPKKEVTLKASEKRWHVSCLNCGATSGSYIDHQEAIDSWNTRPHEDALREKLEKMTELARGYASNRNSHYSEYSWERLIEYRNKEIDSILKG